jgi:tetratricopeptide (TPR) repeat protein
MRPPFFRAAPRLLLVSMLMMAVPRVALAANDFDRYFSSAVSLYENLEYERALEQLARAKKLASGVSQDVAVAVQEGLIYADLGKREESRAAFHTALSLDLEAKLPPLAPPKVRREFEAVRARVQKDLARRAKAAATGKTATTERGAAASTAVGASPSAAGTTDRPERTPERSSVTEPAPALAQPFVPDVKAAPRSRVPVVPAVLLGAGVVAAGVGTYFGLSSRSDVHASKEAANMRTADDHLKAARGPARTANILFATAGVAATAAVVTWLLSSRDEAPVSEVEVVP